MTNKIRPCPICSGNMIGAYGPARITSALYSAEFICWFECHVPGCIGNVVVEVSTGDFFEARKEAEEELFPLQESDLVDARAEIARLRKKLAVRHREDQAWVSQQMREVRFEIYGLKLQRVDMKRAADALERIYKLLTASDGKV